MSEHPYTIEYAKSSRAQCKGCKEKIEKQAIRIGVHTEAKQGFTATLWYHPRCFQLPKKFATGPSRMTALEFLQEKVVDTSDEGDILPAMAQEIAALVETKVAKASAKATDGGASPTKSKLSDLKRQWEEAETDHNKKIKLDPMVAAYGDMPPKITVSALKDELKWNRQTQTGDRDFCLLKVLDGRVHGRLARCNLCGSRLKMEDDGGSVVCMGEFVDGVGRVSCAYRGAPETAPRWQPWYQSAPNPQEEAEMDHLVAVAKGEDMEKDDKNVATLLAGASKLGPWELTSKALIREATGRMVQLLQGHAGTKHVDIPQDLDAAKQKVGPLLAANKNSSPTEIMELIIKEFGFVEDKEAKVAKKVARIGESCKHPKNAHIAAAMHELGDLYFKEGNTNSGAAYNKVVQAINGLDYEITKENAKGLCKGKTKVANIGAKSVEKIFELLTTGHIEKLEEKRANRA